MKKSIFAWVLVLLLALGAVASADKGVVNVYNWEDYIDRKVLDLFTQETGIKVNYMAFTTNEDMMVQVEASPSSFDVVFPSDYCVERLIKLDLLEKINYDNVSSVKEIDPNLLNTDYDPTNEYSVPYMWGTVGILYNVKMVEEPVTSWGILWDSKYANNIFMLDSYRDSLGITLKYMGESMNSRDPLALEKAKDLLIEQKQAGLVKAYQVDETKDKMVAGEAALAVMWSGDAQYAIDLNEDLAYAVPEEGSNIWIDAMVIPKGAKNKENAEKFIEFLCRPEIAQMNCEEIWYSSPNMGAIELMGDEYKNNLTMNPTQDIVDRCEFFHDVHDVAAIYNALWMEVKEAR